MKHEVVEPIQKRQAGSAIGQLIILEDDKKHLNDFKEYME